MRLDKIPFGDLVKEEFNVVIEIIAGRPPVKYEVDKDSEALFVDRFVATNIPYPCNYGFIPNTLADDGDPIDFLVLTPLPVVEGCVIKARPVGVLLMEDEKGRDEKIIGVPVSSVSTYYDYIKKIEDLPEMFLEQLKFFFEHYKSLEKNKWVKLEGFADRAKALECIKQSLK